MSDTEDDFVTYGNALEPLDTENLPRKKPVTVEEQFAYDAQGRRRFHGAFTGGFSAGYFNTVGTRDGWRPQQFKSTRINKAENVVQHPEDFMDDEDVGEFGIAPTAIRATQEYSNQLNKGTKREHYKHDNNEPIPGTPVLKELLKPIRERVGVMLLKKMGWKPGQGVGPRLTKQEKKQKNQRRELVKIYGCALPNQQSVQSDSESAGSDDEYANITFAPDDYEPFRCNPKDNYFGIGYSGLDRRPILGEHINLFEAPTFNLQEKNKKLSIRGQAFGVGAFETEDDDIYAREDMSRYDFALGSQRKSKSRWSKEEAPKMSCLEGFVPGKDQHPPHKMFPPPELPKDFQAMHKVRKSRFSPLAQESQVSRKRYEMNAESRSKIINDERPSIIDSKKVESSNSKVAVNLITRTLNLHGREQKAERQKLEEANAAKKTNMSWLDKLSSTTFVKGEVIGFEMKAKGIVNDKSAFLNEIHNTESNKDTSASKFSFGDLDKQRRFEQYLKFSDSERKLKIASIQPLSMTDWDRDQEAQEFEKTARLCENIDKTAVNKGEKKEDKSSVDIKQYIESMSLEDRMAAAAEMKMFGKLTRTECEWKPAKLVCVRFNIAEPSVGVAVEDTKRKKFSIFDNLAWNEMSKFEKEKHNEEEFEPKPSTSSGFGYTDDEPDYNMEKASISVKTESTSQQANDFEDSYKNIFKKDAKRDEGFKAKSANANVETKKSENPAENMNVQEKKDLYKSIFLSSSEEESESEAEESKSINDEKLKATLIGKSAVNLNVERNTSPPRGIFAKLDLDSLLKRPEKMDITKEKSENDEAEKANKIDKSAETVDSKAEPKQEEESPKEKMDGSDLLQDVYGPALPKVLLQTNASSNKISIFTEVSKKNEETEDSQWVEKTKSKKKSKKEKKKHKHKERSRSKSRKKSKKLKKH